MGLPLSSAAMKNAVVLLLAATALAACAAGSPYRVESRAPTPGAAEQKTYEQLLWEKKRAERGQGGEL